jgi:hypothetical protein
MNTAGTMTPANSWLLFIPHYVPVLDRFQPSVGEDWLLGAKSDHQLRQSS